MARQRLGRIHPDEKTFPVICLGYSAGGLEPCVQIVRALPPDTGAAIVVVNHLRRHPTTLPEIFRDMTAMSTNLITEGMRVRPNHVFVIPRNCELTISQGAFHLEDLSKPYGWPEVITLFLKSLAQNWQGLVVAVILSGASADGAEALRDVKSAGGVTFAEKPKSGTYSQMPRSAVDTGFVDFFLPPEEIAQELISILRAASSS